MHVEATLRVQIFHPFAAYMVYIMPPRQMYMHLECIIYTLNSKAEGDLLIPMFSLLCTRGIHITSANCKSKGHAKPV